MSDVEVYNDRDEDLVQFFEVLRERPDDLVEWLETVPYSRELHQRWVDLYYNGYRPGDPVERAGQFFYLRYAQWGSGYNGPSGFATSKVRSSAQSYANKINKLEQFANRFDQVVLEHEDWQDLLARYDGPETVFYFDPPYVDQESVYPVNDIDHEALVSALHELEGDWLLSYEDLPPGLSEFEVVERDTARGINSGSSGSAKQVQERLVMSR